MRIEPLPTSDICSDQPATFAAMSQENACGVPLPPAAVCVAYSTFTFAKLIVTRSVRRSSPPLPPVEYCVTIALSNEMVRYSSGFSPALRTTILPVFTCLPFAQNSMRFGDAASIHFVTVMSLNFALPEPAPAPACAVPEFARPQFQLRMSILSLYDLSTDSPLTPSRS